MLSVASWLQSLTAAPPLLLDGMTIHPLIGPGAADPALDALGRSNRRVTVLALAPRGPGRFVATVAEPGAQTLLMLQGEELCHDGDLLELVMPRLVPAEGIATVDVRRRKPGGGAPSGKVEARLQRLDAFAPPVGTVGYLAMRGRELARLELFPGPVTCSNRWWWALGSVVELADGREPAAHAETAAASMIRRLAEACRRGPWHHEAWAVQRLQVAGWPSLVGRAISSGQGTVYLDLAQLPGSLRMMADSPLPQRRLAASLPLPPAELDDGVSQRSGSKMLT